MPVEYLSRKQLRHSGLLPKRKSSRMNLFSGMKEGYAFLIDMIIRPPRASYTLEDLGPKVFQIAGHKYERRDFEIVNSRELKLQCSHFVSSAQLKKLAEGKDATHPCVVYLHGNCGCRVDATVALPLLLPAGFSVFCFDFSGSGLSEGEYISLGFYEKDDVTTIVEYLRGCKLVSTIGLWGRSMGAATALMFGASDPSIAGMVLDSPFSSLSKLANELVEHNSHQLPVGIPKIAVSVGMKAIRKSIINKTGLDINELSPIKFAESGFSPVLFVHGQEDDFIQPHHSRELMEKYSGEKNLIIVDGDHNSPRPEYCLDSISIFFHNTLGAMVGEEPVVEEAEPVPFPHFSEKPHFGEMYNSMPHGLVDPEDDDELLQQAMMLSLQEHEKSKDASAV